MTRRAKPTTAAATPAVKQLRVAAYTRQSVESDLEFGSIDAQREAVEAYAKSQRAEGWVVLETRYDDHGFSGGNTDRPAYQRLIADVEAGKVDVIATYKLDRISRSLGDFTRFIELLDKHGVGFVSITQSFDTRTSMGRLTLNILASFSQFERETIAERTRDKVQATRRKGLFTGGRQLLGYDIVNKRLVVNPVEAATVRLVFDLYLEHGGLIATVEELARRGITNKSFVTKDGRQVLGRQFDKETLRTLLTNPVHTGRLRCGDELVPGQHEAIVSIKKYDAVQRALKENRLPFRIQPGPHGAILNGILRCGRCGAAMTHVGNVRGSRLYRYYLCTTKQKRGAAACPGSRGPATEIEDVVVHQLRAIGNDPGVLLATLTAAQRQQTERVPELKAEVHRLQHARTTLLARRTNLLQAIESGIPAASVATRLAGLDAQVEQTDARLDEVTEELKGIQSTTIDEASVRAVLAKFGPVWDSLTPRERQRAIHLLVESVSYNAQAGEIEVVFRDTSIRALSSNDATRRPA